MKPQDQIKAIAELDGCPHSRDTIIPVIEKQSLNIQLEVATYIMAQHASDHHRHLALLTATPAQLCEALLRATGKWKE